MSKNLAFTQSKLIQTTGLNKNWAITKVKQPYPTNPKPSNTDWLVNKSTGLLNSDWTFDVKKGALAGTQTFIVGQIGNSAIPIWITENLCNYFEPINEPSTYNFRNTFSLDNCINITSATIRYATDNSCRIYINGNQVVSQSGFYDYEGSTIDCDQVCGKSGIYSAVNPPATKFNRGGFNVVEVADIASFLEQGVNVIAIENLNSGGCGVNFGWICTNLEIEYSTTDLKLLVNEVFNSTCEKKGSFTVFASGGTAPYIYEFNGISQTNGIFNDIDPGLHNVVVKDKMGCEQNVEILIEDKGTAPLLVIDELDNLKECGDEHIRKDVRIEWGNGVKFSLDNGVFTTNNFFDNLNNGPHSIIAIDEDGCRSIPFNFEVTGSSEFILKYINERICFGESIEIMGTNYSTSGVYLDTIPSNGPCDTLIKIDINVRSLITAQINAEVCYGDSIRIGNKVYNSSLNDNQILTSSTGCDSILNISVRLLDVKSFVETELCAGESVKIGQENYTNDGTYSQVILSDSGCDSTLTIRISMKDEELCENEYAAILHSECLHVNGDQLMTILRWKGKMSQSADVYI
ncbi:MAG: hypothetical protein IPI15_18190 [Saprospiraceae bacterium]|uniref:hypothetical protein n=1 Tax=Candidatus Brachybacter algidus TaxID=2982024 RepID=UPI00257A9229|nr:hypothetical protein [Candidatus Brachybacter algidus]MBK7605455.1 hypothetical protein [Candidatus Brachybacter algidus]